MGLGKNLKQIRRDAGYGRQEFSILINVAMGRLEKIEQGTKDPEADLILDVVRLCNAHPYSPALGLTIKAIKESQGLHEYLKTIDPFWQKRSAVWREMDKSVSESVKDKLRVLRRSGHTFQELADETGVSLTTAYRIAQRELS